MSPSKEDLLLPLVSLFSAVSFEGKQSINYGCGCYIYYGFIDISPFFILNLFP